MIIYYIQIYLCTYIIYIDLYITYIVYRLSMYILDVVLFCNLEFANCSCYYTLVRINIYTI